jgi:HEAT repeat protein
LDADRAPQLKAGVGLLRYFHTLQSMNMKQQLADLRHGEISDAFEAAKDLSSRTRPPVDEIIAILNESQNAHNREAAAYALSWVLGRRNQKPLEVLLATFDKVGESASVRAQALEGFGLQRPTKRNRLRSRVEAAILRGLADESTEVRFWACYAAGTLQVKSALPKLQDLTERDFTICPNWWPVSEEAADAIEWIHGRETASRLPMSRRSVTEAV